MWSPFRSSWLVSYELPSRNTGISDLLLPSESQMNQSLQYNLLESVLSDAYTPSTPQRSTYTRISVHMVKLLAVMSEYHPKARRSGVQLFSSLRWAPLWLRTALGSKAHKILDFSLYAFLPDISSRNSCRVEGFSVLFCFQMEHSRFSCSHWERRALVLSLLRI